MKKTILSVVAFVLFILAMTGCEMVKTIEELTPSSLALTKESGTVKVGEVYTLPTGTVTYTDGTTKTVTLTWDKIVNTAKAGTTTYTASYTENEKTVSAEFKLKVEEKVVVSDAELSSLTLSTTTATVIVGATYTLPTTGTATYTDGTTKTVTLVWDKTVSTAKAGTTTYAASYTEDNLVEVATFTLVVNSIKIPVTLSSVTLSTTTYTVAVGDKYTLPATGTATYSDGTTKTVTLTWNKAVSTTTTGRTVYTASYTENSVTKSATFTLIVNVIITPATLSNLIISPTTATVTVGDKYTLPTTGTATYSDSTTKTVALVWDKTVSTTTAGTTTYTASYTENGVKKSATFTLTVKAVSATLSSLTLSTTTATVNVGATYTLPTTGTATYSDSTTKTVALVWDKTVSTTTAGTTTYTASYTENSVKKSATFNLVVVVISITPKFTIEDVTASVNGTVEVTVKASGFTTGVAGVDLRLYADSTYLTYNSAEFTGVAVGGLTIAKTEDKNINNIVLANIPSSTIILDGTIIKIKFTAIKTGSTKVNMIESKLLNSKGLELEATDISDTATVTIK